MNILTRTRSPSRERGAAAVELALILSIFGVVLLGVPLFFGRVCWHYTVMQKAAHDAALYLASVPIGEINSSSRIGAVVAVANRILSEETAELSGVPVPTVLCGGLTCGGFNVPTTVKAGLQMRVYDPFFHLVTAPFSDDEGGIVLTADVTMPYVGR